MLERLLVVIVLLAPGAEALAAEARPAVPRDGEPFTVVATPEEGESIVRAVLRYCVGSPDRIAYCYPTLEMERSGSSFRATTETGFPAGETLGWNVTAKRADGANATFPKRGDYVFVTVEGTRSDVPLAPLLAGGALALAALRRRRP